MSAIAFKPGQKIKFPPPFDEIIAYFQSIRYETGTPIIGYLDENDEYAEMKGFDLLDCSHG